MKKKQGMLHAAEEFKRRDAGIKKQATEYKESIESEVSKLIKSKYNIT